jgi:hypothetical protein
MTVDDGDDFAKHLRSEHAKLETRSVLAVSHDFDGLLRARSAGLLRPKPRTLLPTVGFA